MAEGAGGTGGGAAGIGMSGMIASGCSLSPVMRLEVATTSASSAGVSGAISSPRGAADDGSSVSPPLHAVKKRTIKPLVSIARYFDIMNNGRRCCQTCAHSTKKPEHGQAQLEHRSNTSRA